MSNVLLNKYLRIIYYFFASVLLFLSFFKIFTSHITFYINDYIFLCILILSFVLVNKYSIKLKVTNLNFNDFILIVCYCTFNIYITVLFIFICYSIAFAIEYKNNLNLNLLTENIYFFNSSIIILSVYISHILLSLMDNIYYLRSYELASVIAFSIILLLTNYILYCLELSLERKSITLITLENGLYYILLNFILCTIIATFSMFMYRLYGYIPTVAMTAFIIFVSFSLNRLDRLKTSNQILKTVSDCTTFLISKADFKIKLQHIVQTIESIIPCIYCGIYLSREKYSFLYPICYDSNTLINLEDLKIISTSDDRLFNEIMSGIPLYRESTFFNRNINAVNTLSKDIKYIASIPIKNIDTTIGFALLFFDRHIELNEEIDALTTLCLHLGMINFNINTDIKNNITPYKNYDGLTKYIDYNIKKKIFFTLAVIEIKNFNDIIQKYNSDFFETFKLEVSRLISKFLSENDKILCFEKEDIYIVFNLLDSKNALSKLEELSNFISVFKFKDIILKTEICYAVSEYPLEGVNSDEILDITYRKLHK